jgi:hypothetical protein
MGDALQRTWGRFERLEAERAAVLEDLATWPAGSVEFRPADGGWTAVEVLDHVVGSGSGTFAGLRAGLERPHRIVPEDERKVEALEQALRSENRFKVPAGGIHPEQSVTLDEVTGRWAEARQQLRAVLESMREEQVELGVFEHPFAGWMTVDEVIDHCSDHLFHHQLQLERLRAAWASRPEREL